jgi:hypothetical protein
MKLFHFVWKTGLFYRPLVCVSLSLRWLSQKDFPQSNLLQRGGNTPEELLSGAPYLHKVALADSATK